MDSIKLSVFLLPKSVFYISTANFCLPPQIWILLEINTKTLSASALILLISDDSPCWLSPLSHSLCPPLLYILERLKYNYIQFYFILSNFYSSFVFIFSPPVRQNPTKAAFRNTLWVGGGTHQARILLTDAAGAGSDFYFSLPNPPTNLLCRWQTPDTVVVVVMLEVVAVAVFGLSTLAYLTALSFNITLELDIVPPPISIYLPLPAPYSFNPVPIPTPGLVFHRR